MFLNFGIIVDRAVVTYFARSNAQAFTHLTVCRDCGEAMVAALPDEYFQELAALSNARGDTVPADLDSMCPQAWPTVEFPPKVWLDIQLKHALNEAAFSLSERSV